MPIKCYKFMPQSIDSLERWLIKQKVEEKDADSLTLEWKEYGVEELLVEILLAKLTSQVHRSD